MRKYQLGLFAVFTMLVTPLQFHMDWYYYLRSSAQTSLSEALGHALVPGTLFFCSLILAMETFLRIENHPHLNSRHWALRTLKYLAIGVPGLLFVFEYMQFQHRHNGNLDSWCKATNYLAAGWALVLAVVVHVVIDKKDAFVRQTNN